MGMDDTRFQALATATLTHCFDQLEPAYDAGALEELELQDGILTMLAASGRTLLLNKHSASQQLWLASPTSGGLHFSYDEAGQHWQLPDGTLLYDLLRRELSAENITVTL